MSSDCLEQIEYGGSAKTTANLRAEPSLSAGPRSELILLFTPGQEACEARYPLPDAALPIGRDVARPGLRVEDPSISRLHARYAPDARSGDARITDENSRNGTFVNGRRVRSAMLAHGDVVRMGESLFVFAREEPMQQVRQQAALAARSDCSVLLRGETGTGKELLARKIHQLSGRAGDFIALNCAGLPRELVAAELFGHAKGAFSGASQRRAGLFGAAQHGTLLLDEIGDCPADVQVTLLRALQERAIRPVGEEREVAVDVRVIAATHKNLEEGIQHGSFRADLFARLAQCVITLPPLRARKHELPGLQRAFAREQACTLRDSADALEALLLWDYPFNARELQALVRRFALSHPTGGTLDLSYLQAAEPQIASLLAERRREGAKADDSAVCVKPATASRREQLQLLLEAHAGNVSRVAAALGKPRALVYRWISACGLSAEKFRP
jgi:transcriptional regulator with PAS, ATPase and Fis domain